MNYVCTPHPRATELSPLVMSSTEDDLEVITVNSSPCPDDPAQQQSVDGDSPIAWPVDARDELLCSPTPLNKVNQWLNSKKDTFEGTRKSCIVSEHDFRTSPNETSVDERIVENNGPVPLSPESQKKKELCSYLQLRNMHSAEKKEVESVRNRRSVRVKNNLLLTERRNLEKELSREEGERSLCRKSFEELKLKVDVRRKSVSGEKVFDLVGVMPKNLLETVGDFKDAMEKFLSSNKGLVRSRSNFWRRKSKKLVDLSLTPKPKGRKCTVKEKISGFFKTPDTRKKKRKKIKSPQKMVADKKKRVNRWEQILDEMPLSNRRILRRKPETLVVKHSPKKYFKKKKPQELGPPEKKRKIEVNDQIEVDENKKEDLTIEHIEAVIGFKIQRTPEKPLSTNFEGFSNTEINESKQKHVRLSACFETIEKKLSRPKEPEKKIENKEESKTKENSDCIDKNVPLSAEPIAAKELPEKVPTQTQSPSKIIKISTLKSALNAVLKSHLNPQLPPQESLNKKVTALVCYPPKSALTLKPAENRDDKLLIQPAPVFKIIKIKATNNNEKATILNGAQTKHVPLPEDISIENDKRSFVPLSADVPVRSLHRSLGQLRKETKCADLADSEDGSPQSWDFSNNIFTPPKNYRHRQGSSSSSHSIQLNPKNGHVVHVDFFDYNLVVTQILSISVWTQSALGSVLGSQDMWIPRGTVERLVLNNGCNSRDSREMVANVSESVAYVELWGKEHKSDRRERPVADVFASVYYWRKRQNGVHRKVLQLENISGFSHDVQYVVMKRSRNIIVSWYCVTEDTRQTLIHCYQMATDYQTVDTVRELQNVDHYVSSLHNILECDDLIMGCGENYITIWNIEFGYIVATINISEVTSPPAISDPDTLWVKCDRGFLFMLRRWSCNEKLCLIAINGISQAWKRLQVFVPPNYCHSLRGVCVKNGVLVAFYENAVLAWNVETGEVLGEEGPPEKVACFPSGEHVVLESETNMISVRDSLAYLITNYGV